ncbi:hypothetical protein E3E36_01130 [Thermococcus sp. M36]|uniref:hypothetical protein n=1 Tax=Thermococcus sp. M36 TaxID=1638261 RepID=UPI00143BFC89|nr:hypothetical protein [Thermococcus sp. M36]NJE04777.1 hypothetical protein [Thermococcus sp. M36]
MELKAKRLLWWASLPFRVLLEFHRGFELYYLQGLQWEEEELENVFALLLFGSYIGLPHPPSELTYRLLPHVLREIHVMQAKSTGKAGVKAGWIGV